MSLLATPRRWRQQPPAPALLNAAHPLVRGMVFAQVGNSPGAPDLVGGQHALPIGAGDVRTYAQGLGLGSPDAVSGWATKYNPAQFRTIQNEFTVACHFNSGTLGDSARILSVPLANGTFQQPQVSIALRRVTNQTTLALEIGISLETTGSQQNATFSGGVFSNSSSVYVVRRKGSFATAVRNNVPLTLAGTGLTALSNVAYSTADTVCLLNRSNTLPASGAAGSGILWVYFWNRYIADHEQTEIYENPYDLLALAEKSTYYYTLPPPADTARTGAITLGLEKPALVSFASYTQIDFSTEFTTDFGNIPGPKSGVVDALLRGPVVSGSAQFGSPSRSSDVLLTLKSPSVVSAALSQPPNVIATVLASFKRPLVDAVASRTVPASSIGGIGVLPKPSVSAEAARTIPDLSAVVTGLLPGHATVSGVAIAGPPLVITAGLTLSKPRVSALARRADPVNDPGLSHIRAPGFRTVDFGTATTAVNWAIPLGPGELKAYTIDCGQELRGVDSVISSITVQLSALAILAGLRIYARTNDTTHITLWFSIDPDDRDKSNWTPPGERHTLDCTVTATRGQIFERTIGLTIRHLGLAPR